MDTFSLVCTKLHDAIAAFSMSFDFIGERIKISLVLADEHVAGLNVEASSVRVFLWICLLFSSSVKIMNSMEQMHDQLLSYDVNEVKLCSPWLLLAHSMRW